MCNFEHFFSSLSILLNLIPSLCHRDSIHNVFFFFFLQLMQKLHHNHVAIRTWKRRKSYFRILFEHLEELKCDVNLNFRSDKRKKTFFLFLYYSKENYFLSFLCRCRRIIFLNNDINEKVFAMVGCYIIIKSKFFVKKGFHHDGTWKMIKRVLKTFILISNEQAGKSLFANECCWGGLLSSVDLTGC